MVTKGLGRCNKLGVFSVLGLEVGAGRCDIMTGAQL